MKGMRVSIIMSVV